jgi:hypothetical protein
MKMKPIFEWWQKTVGEPCEFQIGFRANETRRANNVLEKTNAEGFLEQPNIVGKHKSGRNKWAKTPWQKPVFPMIEHGIFGDGVKHYWQDKPVRFAERNNCIGCFHRTPLLLRKMFDVHPEKMEWFARQERGRKIPRDTWLKGDLTYDIIKKHRLQFELDFDDFSECDSGHCGL